jgi:hypothetical protein
MGARSTFAEVERETGRQRQRQRQTDAKSYPLEPRFKVVDIVVALPRAVRNQ